MRSIGWPSSWWFLPKWRHGTTNGYSAHRCRCPPCREAWSVYLADYRRRRQLANQCRNCQRPLSPYSLVYCGIHLASHNERERTRYRQQTNMQPSQYRVD